MTKLHRHLTNDWLVKILGGVVAAVLAAYLIAALGISRKPTVAELPDLAPANAPVMIDGVGVETGRDGTQFVAVSAHGANPRDLWLALRLPDGWTGTNAFEQNSGTFVARLQLPTSTKTTEPIPITVIDNDSGTTAVAAVP